MTVPVQRLTVIVLCVFGAVWSASAAEKLEVVTLHGQRYVSLQQWSKARNFSFSWNKAEKTVSVSSRWTEFVFNTNSKKASMNGITLWLIGAVAVSGNTVLIQERDLLKTIHPLLYPAKLPPGKKIRTIVIAPGHGGKDPGYQINKEQEKKYTLLMAKALKEMLVKAGFKVVLTRETDKFVELADQAALANRVGADLFINVHYNASVETEANGVETYCLTPAGAVSTNGGQSTPRAVGHRQDHLNPLLAYHVHKSLVNSCSFADRGVRRAAFQVLREINMPGILIEGGFLSNGKDSRKILNTAERNAAARALANGILNFKQIVERK